MTDWRISWYFLSVNWKTSLLFCNQFAKYQGVFFNWSMNFWFFSNDPLTNFALFFKPAADFKISRYFSCTNRQIFAAFSLRQIGENRVFFRHFFRRCTDEFHGVMRGCFYLSCFAFSGYRTGSFCVVLQYLLRFLINTFVN